MTNNRRIALQTTIVSLAQKLIFEAEALIWEARLAMLRGDAEDYPVFLKMAAAKLNKVVRQG